MTQIADYVDQWRAVIERDIASFADPGSALEVSDDARNIHVRWESRGQKEEAVFALSRTAGVRVTHANTTLSYEGFFASPKMADLAGLARMLLQIQKPTLYIETRARRSDLPKVEPQAALELLNTILTSPDRLATQVVMVTGEPGAGKTRVLQELVRRQASDFMAGKTARLFLYVNAQGRALARFNEALATELQDVRASFTYHAVATLVRLGLIVPVIDGFDELLGVSGYDDAFSSLAGFIEELDGEGQLVASARSTYYEQEFVARANSTSSLGTPAWTQVPIQVQAWGDEEFAAYIQQRGLEASLPAAEVASLRSRVNSLFLGPNQELRRRPLFVKIAADLSLKGVSLSGGENLRQELVSGYLEREREEKLLSKDGSPLLSGDDMAALMTTLAEEMWNLETRELDQRTARDVAEYVTGTRGVDTAAARVVIERMPTLAFLGRGEMRGVVFEHEIFFSHFLGSVFASALNGDQRMLTVLLGRSILPDEIAEMVAQQVVQSEDPLGIGRTKALIAALCGVASNDNPRIVQVRENAGRLVAALLRRAGTQGTDLQHVLIERITFPGVGLGGVTLRESKLHDVIFRRVDLSQTQFLRCSCRGIEMTEVTVDPKFTRLELEGIDIRSDIRGLGVRNDSVEIVYDPGKIREVLAACGAVPNIESSKASLRDVGSEDLAVLEKVVRAYRRSNPICTSDDSLRNLFVSKNWPIIEKLLVRNGLVIRELRDTRGSRKDFLRRQFKPELLMLGADRQAEVPSSIRRFWDELEGLVA